jgi:putative transposase
MEAGKARVDGINIRNSWSLYTFFRKRWVGPRMVSDGEKMQLDEEMESVQILEPQKPSKESERKKNKRKKGNANTVVLTERIQIETTRILHELFRQSKDLFNSANKIIYASSHLFILTKEGTQKAGKTASYYEVEQELQGSPEYAALPSQTSQQIIYQVRDAWNGFFEAIKEWKADLKKDPKDRRFKGRPQPPEWKDDSAENLLIFTSQQGVVKNSYLQFPKRTRILPVKVNPTRLGKLKQVRILPRGYYAVVEIVHEKEKPQLEGAELVKSHVVALDLGVRNTVTLVSNCGLRPIVVRGGAVKAINAHYNKQRAQYQSIYNEAGIDWQTKRLERLDRKHNNKIEDIFHKLSQSIINYCFSNRVGTVVIGYNPYWKQKTRLGKRNNQNFVGIPFLSLVEKIQYKAELLGITVITLEESHTSKCSFLDAESIEHHENYLGTRGVWQQIDDLKFQQKHDGRKGKVCHGLFKTAAGKVINSDVNGAYNILRKAFPEFSNDGIGGLGLVPIAVKFSRTAQDFTELKRLANLLIPSEGSV